eukprot:1854050-Amphidinium_carterae.1
MMLGSLKHATLACGLQRTCAAKRRTKVPKQGYLGTTMPKLLRASRFGFGMHHTMISAPTETAMLLIDFVWL